jgi:putative nucleotidyltransferase with HDIG domain
MFVDQIDQIDQIMTLPQVVTQINELVESRTASASDLHRVIKADPALSTKILRLVNSAYYGLPGRVGSLEKAVILLGVTAVKNLAIAAAVEQLFRRIAIPGPLTGRDLWLHCLAVATGARELAERAGMAHLEEVFMAGMIHDLGLLAVAQVAPGDFAEVVQACMGAEISWLAAEMEILGITHPVSGARLAEKWHFPGYLVAMVNDHHEWPNMPQCSDLTGVIWLADTMACGLADGFTLSASRQTIQPDMAGKLGIAEQDLAEVWQNLPAHVDELAGRLHV